jgi:transcriptional regulator with XRE-family HTH domain
MKSIYNKDYLDLLSLLREKRIEKGVTQEQLASLMGVNQGFISKIETHERRLDVIELRSICTALGISLSEFIQELETLLTAKNYEETENI